MNESLTVEVKEKDKPEAKQTKQVLQPVETVDVGESTELNSSCFALPDGVKLGQPIVIEDGKIVVTRLMNTCTDSAGNAGLEKDSPYTAMGIPCSGASGSLELKGHYYAPKLVEMHFSNDCGMHPKNKDQVSKYVYEVLQLDSAQKQLMAFNPLAVQFWELPTGDDADVGYSVLIRSNLAKQMVWPMLKKGESVPVVLYGRENSFTAVNRFFRVEGQVKLNGSRKFDFEVSKITSLNSEELESLKDKCYGLTPKRQCSKVFGY